MHEIVFLNILPEGYYKDELDRQGTYNLASKISFSRTSLDWVQHI